MEQTLSSTDDGKPLRPSAYPADFNRLCQLYGLYRDRMMHEDNLLNHRSSWHLTIQRLLLAALEVVLQPNGNPDRQPALTRVLHEALPYVLAMIGLGVSLFAWLSLDAAHRAIEKIDDDWTKLRRRHDPDGLMPGLAGAGIASIKHLVSCMDSSSLGSWGQPGLASFCSTQVGLSGGGTTRR